MTELEKAHARIEELEAQLEALCTLYGIAQAENGKLRADLEAIGAGGVSGPLMDRAADHFPDATKMASRWYMVNKDGMATLCADQSDAEQGAKEAQTLWPHMGPHRAVQLVEAGSASLSANAGEPTPAHITAMERAWQWLENQADGQSKGGHATFDLMMLREERDALRAAIDVAAPPTAQAEGWVSVDERLPQPNVEVLCAGQGWGNAFVTACYYDDERREWYPINTHWTDATGCAQYPTHWMPLPPSPSMDGESNG